MHGPGGQPIWEYIFILKPKSCPSFLVAAPSPTAWPAPPGTGVASWGAREPNPGFWLALETGVKLPSNPAFYMAFLLCELEIRAVLCHLGVFTKHRGPHTVPTAVAGCRLGTALNPFPPSCPFLACLPAPKDSSLEFAILDLLTAALAEPRQMNPYGVRALGSNPGLVALGQAIPHNCGVLILKKGVKGE